MQNNHFMVVTSLVSSHRIRLRHETLLFNVYQNKEYKGLISDLDTLPC